MPWLQGLKSKRANWPQARAPQGPHFEPRKAPLEGAELCALMPPFTKSPKASSRAKRLARRGPRREADLKRATINSAASSAISKTTSPARPSALEPELFPCTWPSPKRQTQDSSAIINSGWTAPQDWCPEGALKLLAASIVCFFALVPESMMD